MVRYPSTGGVIVTGGAQGIGRRIVHTLVSEGVDVAIADWNEEKGRAVAEETCEGAGRRLFLKCDVASRDDCERVAAETARAFGGIFGIVNNASIFSTLSMRPFWEIPEDEWDQVFNVNLKGVWQMTRAALPELRAADRGSIVNISSSTVHLGRPNYAHYVSSKAGVIGLSRAMSREVGAFGIRVNSVTPGPIFTEVPRATVTEEQKHQMIGMQSLKREGGPQDIASVVAFLLSYQSAFISGQTLNVDGGMVMH
jgi:NAD(P)-dependent dehydrogenase (short-subunit alcohol dehydrogenase family)